VRALREARIHTRTAGQIHESILCAGDFNAAPNLPGNTLPPIVDGHLAATDPEVEKSERSPKLVVLGEDDDAYAKVFGNNSARAYGLDTDKKLRERPEVLQHHEEGSQSQPLLPDVGLTATNEVTVQLSMPPLRERQPAV